ncbi:MAG TPA: nuclear transport factor 2 family protein [Steroidobacteraceae bacterium]|nr:nuclear transport factor 2 family protein [Steroidobacteraceae bacterium]
MTEGNGNDTQFELAMSLSASSGLTPEAHSNRDLMVKAYRAIEAGDQGALTALLDPNVRFVEAPSLPYGCDVRGVEATAAGVSGMMAAWSKIRVDVEDFTAAGDLVIAYMRFTGISRKTGKPYSGECAEVFRFRNSRIIEWRPIYWDTHAAREACH